MPTRLIKKTELYVQLKIKNDASGHDWFHIQRVRRIACMLQAEEGGDIVVIELAALLHNLKEHNYPLYKDTKATLAMNAMLDVLEIEGDLRNKVVEAMESAKFKADGTQHSMLIEGKILQDANWLDSLGAIGIARAFASGGHFNRVLYNPARKVRTKLPNKQYQQKQATTSLNYLQEKSLRVAQLLNTKTAQRIAQQRVEYLKNFIQQFLNEWDGVDLASYEFTPSVTQPIVLKK